MGNVVQNFVEQKWAGNCFQPEIKRKSKAKTQHSTTLQRKALLCSVLGWSCKASVPRWEVMSNQVVKILGSQIRNIYDNVLLKIIAFKCNGYCCPWVGPLSSMPVKKYVCFLKGTQIWNSVFHYSSFRFKRNVGTFPSRDRIICGLCVPTFIVREAVFCLCRWPISLDDVSHLITTLPYTTCHIDPVPVSSL